MSDVRIPHKFKRWSAVPLGKHPARVLIRWELENLQLPLDDYEFYVDRGDAEDQRNAQHVDFIGVPVSDGFVQTESANLRPITRALDAGGFFEYVDYSPELRNLWKQLFYRVRLRRKSTGEEISTPVFSFDPDLDLVGLYIVDEVNFLLEDTTGVPCFVYQRRRGGRTCTVCFDPVQKKRKSSSCTNCYGTNYEGGFYQPIDVYVDFNPTPNMPAIQEWGEMQENQTNVLLANYPFLRAGDLLRELREGRLWRVVRITTTEKRRVPMLQVATVTEVKPDDVEYRMPVDERLVLEKLDYLEKQRSLREF